MSSKLKKTRSSTTINRLLNTYKIFYRSVWFFPTVLIIPLLILTCFQISGSSIGVYHKIFYGDVKDPNLIINEPRSLRGDEWLVTSQLTLSQKENGFPRINQDIGNGQDMSILIDVPYREWPVLFRPHNLAFFILPFDYAFAFRWWVMAYLLIVSCYFFVLSLLPKKRFFASILSIGLLFSPFVQWWYLYGTIGSIAFSLLAGTLFIKIMDSDSFKKRILFGLALTYALTCFALILYPPFQIPCALAMSAFAIGYLIIKVKKGGLRTILQPVAIIAAMMFIAIIITGLYVLSRSSVVEVITNTAYPGQRKVNSGGFEISYILSGHLSYQLTDSLRFANYAFGENQSEASNFINLLPYLFLPGIYLVFKSYRKFKELDWSLILTSSLFVLFLIRMLVPGTNWLFNLLFLRSVPHVRILIGIGLLSLIHTVLIVKSLARFKTNPLKHRAVIVYSIFVAFAVLFISFNIHNSFPGFIGVPKTILLSIPIPIIVYLMLTRRFELAAIGLTSFLIFSSIKVNPLYRGTDIITDTPLSHAIKRLSAENDGRWVSETSNFEHFPIANGARSLAGVYPYPQLDLWKDTGTEEEIYNRYSHVFLLLDHEADRITPSRLALAAPDTMLIVTEPCSDLLKERDVSFIIAESPVPDSCLTLKDTVSYPAKTLYIYEIKY